MLLKNFRQMIGKTIAKIEVQQLRGQSDEYLHIWFTDGTECALEADYDEIPEGIPARGSFMTMIGLSHEGVIKDLVRKVWDAKLEEKYEQ